MVSNFLFLQSEGLQFKKKLVLHPKNAYLFIYSFMHETISRFITTYFR